MRTMTFTVTKREVVLLLLTLFLATLSAVLIVLRCGPTDCPYQRIQPLVGDGATSSLAGEPAGVDATSTGVSQPTVPEGSLHPQARSPIARPEERETVVLPPTSAAREGEPETPSVSQILGVDAQARSPTARPEEREPVVQPPTSASRGGEPETPCIPQILGLDAQAQLTCLQSGHPAVPVEGPAILSLWEPEQPGREYVYLLPPGQQVTVTLPGQVWAYPSDCFEVMGRDMLLHAERLAGVNPQVAIVIGTPPRW